MNPWDIVGWIGAGCTSIIILALTVRIVLNLAKATPRTSKTTRIQ